MVMEIARTARNPVFTPSTVKTIDATSPDEAASKIFDISIFYVKRFHKYSFFKFVEIHYWEQVDLFLLAGNATLYLTWQQIELVRLVRWHGRIAIVIGSFLQLFVDYKNLSDSFVLFYCLIILWTVFFISFCTSRK